MPYGCSSLDLARSRYRLTLETIAADTRQQFKRGTETGLLWQWQFNPVLEVDPKYKSAMIFLRSAHFFNANNQDNWKQTYMRTANAAIRYMGGQPNTWGATGTNVLDAGQDRVISVVPMTTLATYTVSSASFVWTRMLVASSYTSPETM